jgi:hypothetical protein
MTIKVHKVRSAEGAFDLLERISSNGHVRFRGHRDAKWRVESTLARHFGAPFGGMTALQIHEMIDHFLVNLTSIGIPLPFDKRNSRARLEFARHYGVPSPLIDFTLSPYVALFFAFNGVRPSEARVSDYAAIYCLNIFELARVWARSSGASDESKIMRSFLNDRVNRFEEYGYPLGVIEYLEMPASWNRRMQRQLGVFIYDSLNCETNYHDLEEFLEAAKPYSGAPELATKLLIPHKVGREIFERLEIMGVTATLLFENQEGAAADVINAYNYGRRTGRAWDI